MSSVIDAGHYETERPALQTIVRYIKNACVGEKEEIQVMTSSTMRNFVQYSLT